MMRYRFLLLACWMLVTPSHAESSSKSLPRPVDEIIVNAIMEPIQPSELEVLVLMQPGQCAPSQDKWNTDNAVVVRRFACGAFLKAVADGKATLPLHVQQLASAPQSEKAVLDHAKSILSGRRYVAMIMWDVIPGPWLTMDCDPCRLRLEVPMEIVVMDTQRGAKVWQSHHVSQVSYTDRHFDATRARMLGLNGMQRLVNVVLSQRQLLAAESTGMQRTRGFLMTDTQMRLPPLNPEARLIIVNNDHFDNNTLEKRYTVMLTAVASQPESRALYTIPLHGFVALKLPTGKYALKVSKETTHEFEIGDQPVYLAVKSPQWEDRQEVRPISADQLRDLSLDLVNALMPETTPASYDIKGHSLYWPKP